MVAIVDYIGYWEGSLKGTNLKQFWVMHNLYDDQQSRKEKHLGSRSTQIFLSLAT